MAKKMSQQSKDAVILGGLFVLSFVVLQMVNFIGSSIHGDSVNLVILKAKMVAHAIALLTAYFIALIYIKSRTK